MSDDEEVSEEEFEWALSQLKALAGPSDPEKILQNVKRFGFHSLEELDRYLASGNEDEE